MVILKYIIHGTLERLLVSEINIDTKKDYLNRYLRGISLYAVITLLIVLVTIFFSHPLYSMLGNNQFITIHLILELVIIVVCIGIANQLWFTTSYTRKKCDILFGALFFFLGFMYLAHTLSYKGMPFFIPKNSADLSTWYFMIGRIVLAMGMIVILNLKNKRVSKIYRWLSYTSAFLLASLCFLIVFFLDGKLPPLIIEGIGSTTLKNSLQFFASFMQWIVIFYLVRHYQFLPKRSILLFTASIYLMFSDLMFTVNMSIYDLYDFLGHLFQIFAFLSIFKALYYSTIDRPYQKILQMNQDLANSKKKMFEMTYFDEITQLPNQRYINEIVTEKMRQHEPFSLIVFELERFATIKSILGTHFTEEILKMVAEKLSNQYSDSFVFGKLRGDQFAIITDGEKNEHKLEEICYSIQQIFHKPIQIQNFSFCINLYFGIASFPDDAKDEESIIKYAQIAMYEAFSSPHRVQFYQSTMVDSRCQSLILENDLYEAIQNNELFLQYQPQVEMLSGKIRSLEALVRWRHPKKGIISPEEFITIAENSGLIVPLGKWILETACLQTKELQQRLNEPIKVSVNLSIGQLYHGNFVEETRGILESTGLSSQSLELEITESMTMNTKQIESILYGLKEIGVSVVVDDFGTGYSSLNYLKDLPINSLKIDREFVKHMKKNQPEPIIDMILSMAKHLQLKVIAEGIETIDQLAYLQMKQCDYIQGFIVCEPLDMEEMIKQYHELEQKMAVMLGYSEIETYVK